jgi:hypothetical protein
LKPRYRKSQIAINKKRWCFHISFLDMSFSNSCNF